MGARNRYYLEKGGRFIKKFMLLSTNCSIVLDINVAPRCIIEDEIFRLTNLMNLHVGENSFRVQLELIAVAFLNFYPLKQLKRTIFNKHSLINNKVI